MGILRRIETKHPVHMVIIADNSNSIRNEASIYSQALQEWIYSLQSKTRGEKAWFFISYILMGTDARVLCEFTNVNDIDAASLRVNGEGGATNMVAALQHARSLVEKYHQPNHCEPAVFLYTDGKPFINGHRDERPGTLQAAQTLYNVRLPDGITQQGMQPELIVVGVGRDIERDFMARLPRSPAFAKFVAAAHQLLELLPEIGTPVLGSSEQGGIWDAVKLTEVDEL